MTASLSPKQAQAIVESLDGPAQVNLWSGAVRSGKTLSSIIAWCEYVRTAPPGPLLMVGKTKDTLQRNVLDELDAYWGGGAASPLQHTRGANEGMMFGRRIHMVGANDVKSETRIRGLTLAGTYVDEATLLPNESYWSMLLTRHLTVDGAKLFLTTNPDSPAHWLKRKVIDAVDERARAAVWRFTLDDNPTITPARREQLEAALTGLFHKRFILGEWVAAEGAIYDMLDLDGPNRTTWATVPRLTGRTWLGVDYGDQNPFHAVLVAEALTGQMVVVGEWRYSGRETRRQKTHVEYEQDMRQWLTDLCAERSLSWPMRVAVDPSAAGFRGWLRRQGWSGLTEPEDQINAVRDGIRDVGALMQARRLLFVEGAAPVLERELLGYVWDEKASLRGEDVPVKVDDHGADAIRYCVAGARSVWRPWLAAALPLPA